MWSDIWSHNKNVPSIYSLFILCLKLFSTHTSANLRQFVFPGLKGLGIISKVRQCGYWTNSLFRLEAPCGKPLDRKSTSTALEPKDGDCSPSLSRPTTGSTPCAHRKWKIQHYTFSNIEPIRIRLPDNFQSRQNQTIDNHSFTTFHIQSKFINRNHDEKYSFVLTMTTFKDVIPN